MQSFISVSQIEEDNVIHVQCIQRIIQCGEGLLMKPLHHGSKPMQGKWKQHLAIQEYSLPAGPLLFHTSFS